MTLITVVGSCHAQHEPPSSRPASPLPRAAKAPAIEAEPDASASALPTAEIADSGASDSSTADESALVAAKLTALADRVRADNPRLAGLIVRLKAKNGGSGKGRELFGVRADSTAWAFGETRRPACDDYANPIVVRPVGGGRSMVLIDSQNAVCVNAFPGHRPPDVYACLSKQEEAREHYPEVPDLIEFELDSEVPYSEDLVRLTAPLEGYFVHTRVDGKDIISISLLDAGARVVKRIGRVPVTTKSMSGLGVSDVALTPDSKYILVVVQLGYFAPCSPHTTLGLSARMP